MYFQSFKEFIEMGGHGFYVWLCYSTVLFSLLLYYIYSQQLAKSRQKNLASFYKRMEARQRDVLDQNLNLGANAHAIASVNSGEEK